jgi:hypothetical protein
MPETIVLSAQTTPPLVTMTNTLFDQWTAWKTDLLTATIFCKLFVNNVIVSAATVLSDLTEATAPGYLSVAVTTLNGPFLDQAGNAYMTTPENLFVCSGGGADICYGAYLVSVTGAAATATFTEASGAYTAPVVTGGGSGYLVPPKVTPTGATGSGAVLVAVLTAGVVTGITIVSPGTGYTTATATIEPPTVLVEAGNFPSPRPLQTITDAIPVVLELDNLAA